MTTTEPTRMFAAADAFQLDNDLVFPGIGRTSILEASPTPTDNGIVDIVDQADISGETLSAGFRLRALIGRTRHAFVYSVDPHRAGGKASISSPRLRPRRHLVKDSTLPAEESIVFRTDEIHTPGDASPKSPGPNGKTPKSEAQREKARIKQKQRRLNARLRALPEGEISKNDQDPTFDQEPTHHQDPTHDHNPTQDQDPPVDQAVRSDQETEPDRHALVEVLETEPPSTAGDPSSRPGKHDLDTDGRDDDGDQEKQELQESSTVSGVQQASDTMPTFDGVGHAAEIADSQEALNQKPILSDKASGNGSIDPAKGKALIVWGVMHCLDVIQGWGHHLKI
ncbi:unnamed protein product [Parascedosporium putredinis]|uniref:Uncharacterized protein n=1 Tax=Parascedosporium putredinis TaxID=1442378 RepID=A0A9P1MB90_9PEZI|nr:unnamed protein product [Parascedosporium putredinis]CAI7994190.1 unnamed protein product [Parascedosporium putredinis]